VRDIFRMWESSKLKKADTKDVCEEHKL